MRLQAPQKIALTLTLLLSAISAALALSALRTYLHTTPTTGKVVRVETRERLVANPITEHDLLNPSAARTVRLHDVYLEIPELKEQKEPLLLALTTSPAPKVGEIVPVRYRGDGGSIEIFQADLSSLLTPAALSGILALVTLFLFVESAQRSEE